MIDKLCKRYVPKKPEIIMEWARACLKEADRVKVHGVRTISSNISPNDRDKVAIYLKAEATYQDMESSIGQEFWGRFSRDLERFYSLICHWDLGIYEFVEKETQKYLPRTTAKARLQELIDKDPHWMTHVIKADLLELINKGTVRKGKNNA